MEAPLPEKKPIAAQPIPPSTSAPQNEFSHDANNKKSSSFGKILTVLTILILLGLFGVGLLLFLNSEKLESPTPDRPINGETKTANATHNSSLAYLNEGWKTNASNVLKGFLAAETAEEMAPFVIGGEEKIPAMRAYYENSQNSNKELRENQFRHVTLVMEDRERGIFMMDLQRPVQWSMKDFFRPLPTRELAIDPSTANFNVQTGASIDNFTMEEERIFAFFKEKDQEMRLDWDIFVQTKDRLLEKFISFPRSGQSAIFRGTIIEDVTAGVRGVTENSRVYRFIDMAHLDNVVRVAVPNDSEEGKFLSEIAWRGKGVQAQPKNITLELKWGMEADPILKISRILCWEFLGIGGELREEAKSSE